MAEFTEYMNEFEKLAYEKGRADLLMPYDVESIEELIENVKSKAREDAIDEAMKILHELRNDDTNEVGMISVEKAEVYSKIRSILEQLKEKSNE